VHHAVECRLAVLFYTVPLVQLIWTVDGEANQEVILLEDPGPIDVQKHSVGLEGILDSFSASVFLLNFGTTKAKAFGRGGTACKSEREAKDPVRQQLA